MITENINQPITENRINNEIFKGELLMDLMRLNKVIEKINQIDLMLMMFVGFSIN